MSKQVAIELNDNGIIVGNGQQLLLESPGYIIDVAGQEWIGKEARDRAQLHPNECSNRFWSELAQTQTNSVNQNNVKLALRHMASVWQQVSLNAHAVILTVPATFTKTGLGLLLGICKELSIPVRAMVHQAVLAPRQLNHVGATTHLDMQLHHTAITLLEEQEDEFSVSTVELLDDIGFASIYVVAAEYIAQAFISATRLDPLHSAELEQQLFNLLPTWLEQAQTRDAVQCQLEYKSSLYKVTIDAERLKATLKSPLNKIIQTLLSFDYQETVIACVPEMIDRQLGFNRYANDHGVMVRSLSLGYHAQQSLVHAKHLIVDDAQIYLNKKLPCITLMDSLEEVRNKQSLVPETEATHVLYQHHAYPISESLYLVETTDGDFQLQNDRVNESQKELLMIYKAPNQLVAESKKERSIKINDQDIQSHIKVSVGDRIVVNAHEHELVLIRVKR